MNRIVSCYSNSYGPPGVRPAVEGISAAGLSYVELALRGHDFGGLVIPESAVVIESTPAPEVSSFLGLLRDRSVKVSGCNVGGADLRTPEGFELTASRIRFANATFRAPLAVSGAGQPTDSHERKIIIEHLRRLGDLATDLGMLLTLETHKGPTQNAQAMLDLMGDLDHPGIRINFDTGNIAFYNLRADPVDELQRVKHLVGSVHLKDNRGGLQDWFFPALGEGGAVDFRRIREILDEVGFSGPYTIELEGIGGEPEPGQEERHRRVARSVYHLRACGYFD
ncbi:sugar phosphate isomerase/epimerase family protein [Tundrisphaera lichenicola]|uniref:sugar phosphate isomerase/epimerase family protein n=1 Tax=Tundrisphaera lichenicola TaxID=2029860 RepID=UPI003EBC6731